MGFLVPIAFLAGAALLLAVTITYLLKPSRPSRRISSTWLWMAAYHELQARRPWRRVPPSVLLLLQILALAALVIALARPYVMSAEATGPDTLVLLDVSASMHGTDVAPSRFEAARARVRQLIDELEPEQTLGLVSLGAEPRLVAPRTSDREVLRRALDGIQPTTQPANLAAALSLAASLADGRPETAVFIVGDGALDRSQIPADLPFVLRSITVGGAADNLALATFGTRTVDNRLAALARVANYTAARRTATVELRIDGTRFDARFVAIEPGASADAQWEDLPSTARVLEARLVEPDALALDNTAWAVAGADRPVRILLVSEANVFLERALALRPHVEVVRVTPEAYAPDPDQTFDLVVFDDFLPPALPEAGSLLLIHPPQGTPLLRVGGDVLVSRIEPARDDHPLLADVPLAGVHVNRARRLEAPAWASAVVGSPETPLLLIGDLDGRRVAVQGFDIHQSDLPLQPAFPILVQHLLEWLVPPGSVATPVVRVGDAASIVPLPGTRTVDVATPDGRRVRVVPPAPAPPFVDTLQPGVYEVHQADANGQITTSLFAANFVSPGESQLAVAELPATLSASPGTVLRSGVPAAPRELWQWAAIAALVVLAAEWLAYHRQ